MKKSIQIITMTLAVVITMMLSSCDKDQIISAQLQTYWRGQISQQDFYSRWKLNNSGYYTVFHFTGSMGSRHGSGYEMDYNSRNSNDYYTEHFEYWVKDEVIQLDYDNGTQAEIRNYRLTDTLFEGYIDYYYGNKKESVRFSMTRDDFFNADPFMHGFFLR